MVICSTLGGKRLNPPAAWLNANESSCMITPAEISFWLKVRGWATRGFQIGKRIATLESRVTALEQALTKQPASACPYCGERAARMVSKSVLLGNQGSQWWEEYWVCEKCAKTETRHRKL
jgi:hypothetical protein